MGNTLTVVDGPSPYWVIRIPKPAITRGTVRWMAVLALSVGFNVGFVADAMGADSEECQASAELHYAISGGEDAAYENALAACNGGVTYSSWLDFEQAYELAGRCQTPTSWAENMGNGWMPVCGDADGNAVGAP